jgi:hypothetical protein
MADPKSKTAAPNFYSTLADSAAGGAGGAGGGPGMSPDQSKPATQSGAKGEKAQNIATLLEVFKKMDSMEEDPAGKDILQQMLNLGMKYKAMVDGGAGSAATGAAASAGAGGPAGAGPAGPGAGAPPPSPMAGGGQVP